MSGSKLGVMHRVIDEAIEAGAEDVEASEDGCIVVWTEPNKTMAAADALQKSLNLKVESSDILWDPNEDTKVSLESGAAVKALLEFLDALHNNPQVQGVYANISQGSLADDVWEDLQCRLDA